MPWYYVPRFSRTDYVPSEGVDSTAIIMQFLFQGLMFIVSLVLLNLLIALMGSSYEAAQESAVSGALYEQASILLELEALMTKKERQREDWFPPWVHVLRALQKELLSDEEKLLHGVRKEAEVSNEKLDDVQSRLALGEQARRRAGKQAISFEAKRKAFGQTLDVRVATMEHGPRLDPQSMRGR